MTVAGALRRSIYFLTFANSFQFGLILYFSSAFLLGLGLSNTEIGFVYTFSYSLGFCILFFGPLCMRRFGNRALFASVAILDGLLFASLPYLSPSAAIAVFAIANSISLLLPISLDLFLEATSGDENKTGMRRGLVIALVNLSFIIAQFVAVYCLALGSFSYLYAISGAILVVLGLLSLPLLSRFRDPRYHSGWRTNLLHLMKDASLRRTFVLQFLIRFFYGAMVIYTPLYLLETVGLSYAELSIVFAIMLLPFVFLEVPFGVLEDRLWGEKEALIAGSLIVAISTALLSFIVSQDVALWACALAITRIGAALLEVSSDAYFFKHVRGRESDEVTAYRMLYPLGHLMGPLFGALFVYFYPTQYIFAAIGIVMLVGIPIAWGLRDTK